MFSLVLSLCIFTGTMDVCEEQVIDSKLTVNECFTALDNTMARIKNSPANSFEWQAMCEIEDEGK